MAHGGGWVGTDVDGDEVRASQPPVDLHHHGDEELDSRADQLRHQLASLPEAKELAALGAERAQVDTAARDARIQVEDLTREQRKADADVEQVRARQTRDQQRMDLRSKLRGV